MVVGIVGAEGFQSDSVRDTEDWGVFGQVQEGVASVAAVVWLFAWGVSELQADFGCREVGHGGAVGGVYIFEVAGGGVLFVPAPK